MQGDYTAKQRAWIEDMGRIASAPKPLNQNVNQVDKALAEMSDLSEAITRLTVKAGFLLLPEPSSKPEIPGMEDPPLSTYEEGMNNLRQQIRMAHYKIVEIGDRIRS